MIAVVDYGMGNLRSVTKALERLGGDVLLTSNPEQILEAKKLIVPGVGAFPAAMSELNKRRLSEAIKESIVSGKPYLGICLGLQLLFEKSQEGEGSNGLGIFKGSVDRFPEGCERKIPHMGWNQAKSARNGEQACPLLKGIPDGSFFYFVHSYYVNPDDDRLITLETDYGIKFASMIWEKNIYATQFHPEKSQSLGLKMLENFINL